MINPELIAVAEGKCEQHQADHSFRVMKLDRKIFEKQLEIDGPEEIRKNQDFFLNVLDWTAVLHDREMDGDLEYDFDHGEKAAKIVDEIVGDKMNDEGKKWIKFLCIYHVPDDGEIPPLTEMQKWLLSVFKDADGLDRVRFENGDKLDENFLRTESAKTLIAEARELWEKTKGITEPQAAFDAVFGNRVE